ncbi:MAG: CehA/McbA family metallohydrolase [Blastocatellia bacterium]
MSKLFFTLAVLVMPLSGLTQNAENAGAKKPKAVDVRWYKGNTHAHTLNSDGDSSPEDVVKWYAQNGYNFLFITDHEFITPVEPLNKLFAKPGEFVVFPGQEVTDRTNGKPHHINGLGISSVTMPKRGKTSLENLQLNVDGVRSLGGVPQINHPNFGWALTAVTISKTRNVMLFELFNGHPLVNNLGGGGSPGTEEIWDLVLSSGRLIYGLGTDDSHFFKRIGDKTAPTPGQAWIMVRAAELTKKGILGALERGDFYASTGVELGDYHVNKKSMTIVIKQERSSKYRIQFIGRGGRMLSEATSSPATYNFRGNEMYVRAKIIESNGKMAWTQPVMIGNNRAKSPK